MTPPSTNSPAETLYLRFNADHLDWLLLGEEPASDSNPRSGRLTDAAFQEQSALTDFTGHVVIIVPGEDVLLTSAEVPSKQYRRIVQAVPYVIEEQLAMDVDACFFAIGPEQSGSDKGEVEVAVVSRVLIQDWVARCDALGVSSARMIPETAMLPPGPGVRGVIEGDRTHLAWGRGRGMTTRTTALPRVVSLIPDNDRKPVELYVESTGRAAATLPVSELQLNEGVDTKAPRIEEFDGTAFEFLCRSDYTRHQATRSRQGDRDRLNLLQGEFSRETSTRDPVWRSVAMLAMATLMLHLALLLGQGLYLSYQASTFEQASRDLYQQIFRTVAGSKSNRPGHTPALECAS